MPLPLPFPLIRPMRWCRAGALAAALACAPLMAHAETPSLPVQVDLAGSVTDAQGAWASQLESDFFASAVLGLDPAAGISRYEAPGDEPPYRVWMFSGDPYRAGVLGFDGALSMGQESYIEFETLDDLATTASDNPFGLSGTFDVIALPLAQDNFDGTTTYVDVYLINPDTSWFSDGGLPTAIPGLGVGGFSVLGQGWLYGSGDNELGTVLMSFDAMEVSSVPEPSAVWMLVGGLFGVLGWARRWAPATRRRR